MTSSETPPIRSKFVALYAARAAARQRAFEREERAQVRAVAAATREAERARKALERAQAQEQKEQKRLYLEARQAEVEALNAELEAEVAEDRPAKGADSRLFPGDRSLLLPLDVSPARRSVDRSQAAALD